MKIIKYPLQQDWKRLLQRPAIDNSSLQANVRVVMNEVKTNGDDAVKKFTQQFDGVVLDNCLVSEKEISEAEAFLSDELKKAIQLAAANIQLFHEKQVAAVEVVETMPGVQCWRKSIGIEKVGLYIPGGTAPLFSTILMLGDPCKNCGLQRSGSVFTSR